MLVELSEATVPVSRDYVELVWVESVWSEDLLEVVKSRVGLSFSRCLDGGDSEVLASYFDV